MAKQVQIRKGTTAENDGFTGALGELSCDTQQNRLRVHDGATPGGFPHALRSEVIPRAGNAVLVAGTVTVNDTTVTANTIVMLTRKTSGGTPGTLITYTVSAGTSFTINSDSALDTSTFSYFLIEVP